jgi:hypothetical protein
LELDNADLTQKLMHLDKNLRQKFGKEYEQKFEAVTESFRRQKDDELRALRDELTAKYMGELEVIN